MNFDEILAALTTEPAELFVRSPKAGRIAAGYRADIVVLARDPRAEPGRLADARYVIRRGRMLYPAPK
jgi:imidazolonepropionase-like amidohydrolase